MSRDEALTALSRAFHRARILRRPAGRLGM